MRIGQRAVRRVIGRYCPARVGAGGWGGRAVSKHTPTQVAPSGVCKNSSTLGTEISYLFHVDGGT